MQYGRAPTPQHETFAQTRKYRFSYKVRCIAKQPCNILSPRCVYSSTKAQCTGGAHITTVLPIFKHHILSQCKLFPGAAGQLE